MNLSAGEPSEPSPLKIGEASNTSYDASEDSADDSSNIISGSSDPKERERVENTYKRYETFMAQKDVKAKDILTQEQIEHFALEEDEKILLDKTTPGILVSSSEKVLFIVTSEVKYGEITSRKER